MYATMPITPASSSTTSFSCPLGDPGKELENQFQTERVRANISTPRTALARLLTPITWLGADAVVMLDYSEHHRSTGPEVTYNSQENRGSTDEERRSTSVEPVSTSVEMQSEETAHWDQELPEDIATRVSDPDPDKKITQRGVALEFVHGDRPYYSNTQMHAALSNIGAKETVGSRMSELCERGVLKKETVNTGSVYWLDREDSEWPLPPDVEVEPKREEPTVQEWIRRPYALVGVLSILASLLGSMVLIIGVLQSSGSFQSPLSVTRILTYGITMGMMSVSGIALSFIMWLLWTSGLEPEELLSDLANDE